MVDSTIQKDFDQYVLYQVENIIIDKILLVELGLDYGLCK